MYDPLKPKEVEEHYIVTVCYKSGNKVTGRFSDFKIKGCQWTWVSVPNKKYPDCILSLGADEIESVWYKVEEAEE